MRSTTKIRIDPAPCKFKSNVLAIVFMAMIAAFIVLVIYAAMYIASSNVNAIKPVVTFNKVN